MFETIRGILSGELYESCHGLYSFEIESISPSFNGIVKSSLFSINQGNQGEH